MNCEAPQTAPVVDTPPVFSRPARGVGLIELNRPNVANRIEVADFDSLTEILTECENDPEVRVLVIAARGRYFSSGFDLRALVTQAASGESGSERGDGGFERLANRLEQTGLITIAGIQGPVFGGSTDLVLACDFRIGTQHTYMQMPAAQFGLPLYSSALQRYVSRLGINAAKKLILTSTPFDASEMKATGFLTSLVDASVLRDECLELANQMARLPGEPLSAMKRVLNAAAVGQGNSDQARGWLRLAFDGRSIIERVSQARTSRLVQKKGSK